MKAAVYEKFRSHVSVIGVPDPTPDTDGVVLRIKSTDVCRSDWHG